MAREWVVYGKIVKGSGGGGAATQEFQYESAAYAYFAMIRLIYPDSDVVLVRRHYTDIYQNSVRQRRKENVTTILRLNNGRSWKE